jgi:cell division protein ZapA
METDEKKSVKVHIFGEDFPIRSEAEPEYTKMVADYVDSIMKNVNRSMKPSDARIVAVLAAMSITDELFQARRGLKSLSEELKKKTEEILSLLETGER